MKIIVLPLVVLCGLIPTIFSQNCPSPRVARSITDNVDLIACLAGETYVECGHSCMESCNPDACNGLFEKCSPQCICKGTPNMVRINGQCVPRDRCQVEFKCEGENEEWTIGNHCKERCMKDGMVCDGKVYWGCFCKPGYVRINGKCQPEHFCYSDPCPDDRVYMCGDPCTQVCPKLGIFCPERDCIKGCYCKEGLVDINGKCVPPEHCPGNPCCRDDQVYMFSNNCTQICGLENHNCGPMRWDCFCPPGFRELNGRCIPVEKCPVECVTICNVVCPAGMYYSQCTRDCDYNCSLCPVGEPATRCKPGCVCKDPNMIPYNGQCVHREKLCGSISIGF